MSIYDAIWVGPPSSRWSADSETARLRTPGWRRRRRSGGAGLVWGFPKIRGDLFGESHNKVSSILGSMLGSFILGNCHMSYSLNSLKGGCIGFRV